MPTREQVRRLLNDGFNYAATGQRLGIPPGQAYLIATGIPADGSGTITEEEASRPGFLPSSQHLTNPPHENPATPGAVAAWLRTRVKSDEQMRAAAAAGTGAPGKARDAVSGQATRRKRQPRRSGQDKPPGNRKNENKAEGEAG